MIIDKTQKMKIIKYTSIVVLLITCLVQSGCKKYLDAKPDKALAIPQSVKELQGLLNLETNNNGFPIATLFADDNVYSPYANWNAIIPPEDKLAYIWDANVDLTRDYGNAYTRIFNANIVIEKIDEVNDPVSTRDEYNMAKGSAYFLRAYNNYELSQLIAPQYSAETASTSYGIPLKKTSAIEDPTVRSTIQQTYDQVISDARTSLNYLSAVPALPASLKIRPSKAAAFALLARTYLVMGNYQSALQYADSCLNLYSNLLNYNSSPVSITATNPFPRFNDEVIFHVTARNATSLNNIRVDTSFFNSYDNNDLRKTALYRINTDGTYNFKGNYNATGNRSLFSGIATDEVYLIRAEAKARLGQFQSAMDDVNTLMVKRWKTGTFVPFTASSADQAISIILNERRKELAFRGSLEWSDLRRLNKEPSRARTVTRVLNGTTYTLSPSDLRYTFLIPPSVINMSGITQNPR